MTYPKIMRRRNFLKQSAIAGIAATSITKAFGMVPYTEKGKVLINFGICTDLHHDLIKDGEKRLQAFIEEMNQLKPHFIIQTGDFCMPKEKNRPLMEIWDQFKQPSYHVLGNHDTDGGFTHDQVITFWKATGKYYSFDQNGYHFVVLNGNERPQGDTSQAYPRSIGKEQINWMKKDIENTRLPVIIFCHQGIDNDQDGIKEGSLIRLIFERLNQKAGFNQIRLVFSGHHHEDYHNIYNNIHYIQINSMSYQFSHAEAGDGYASTKDPLWAYVSIYDNGIIKIKGKKSVYPNPENQHSAAGYNGYPTVPYISDRIISLRGDQP